MKNLQGDVTGLMTSDGTTVISYEYDAWGNVIDEDLNDFDYYAVSILQVYRYRSYIYDNDTGFYYLQSRYYDPAVGRFINADDTSYLGASGTVLSYNLYAYCENNCVIYSDDQGTYIQYAAGAIVGGLLNAVLYIVDCLLAKTNISYWKLLLNFLNGAINGFIAALGGSLLRQIFASVGSSIISLFIGSSSPSVQDFVIAIISGVLSGVFAGTMGNGNNKHINRLMNKFGKKISKSIFKSSFGKTVVNGITYVINNSKTIIKNFLSSYVIPNIRIAIGSRAVGTIWKLLS